MMDTNREFVLSLDQVKVRFTPEGKVSVIDSIQALLDTDNPEGLWESVKREHPDILEHCESYDFHNEPTVQVMDTKGWARMQEVLPYYLDGMN